MWISRNKFDTYENDSLVLWLDDEKPTRKDNDPYKYWFGICGIELKPYSKTWYDKYSYLKWEDEPIEVNIIPAKELSSTQKELKDVYHKLFESQTENIKLQNQLKPKTFFDENFGEVYQED